MNPLASGAYIAANNAFRSSTSLQEVLIPGNALSSLGSYTFYSCSALSSVKTNTNEIAIGTYCFGNCSNLKYASIPNLKSINTYAFTGHSSSKPLSLDFSARTVDYVPPVQTNSFSNSVSSIVCIVPSEMEQQWRDTDVWSTFISNNVVQLKSTAT